MLVVARLGKSRRTQQPRRRPQQTAPPFALSNAPADEDPRVLIGDGLGRNVVERNFRDAKSEVGMADYQTRGWRAWHHHMS
jgi:SRSO17 transposase